MRQSVRFACCRTRWPNDGALSERSLRDDGCDIHVAGRSCSTYDNTNTCTHLERTRWTLSVREAVELPAGKLRSPHCFAQLVHYGGGGGTGISRVVSCRVASRRLRPAILARPPISAKAQFQFPNACGMGRCVWLVVVACLMGRCVCSARNLLSPTSTTQALNATLINLECNAMRSHMSM